jgi:hypothetical protein
MAKSTKEQKKIRLQSRCTEAMKIEINAVMKLKFMDESEIIRAALREYCKIQLMNADVYEKINAEAKAAETMKQVQEAKIKAETKINEAMAKEAAEAEAEAEAEAMQDAKAKEAAEAMQDAKDKAIKDAGAFYAVDGDDYGRKKNKALEYSSIQIEKNLWCPADNAQQLTSNLQRIEHEAMQDAKAKKGFSDWVPEA